MPPWRTPTHKPNALLPHEFRHSVKEWSALKSYDKWRRGEQLDREEDKDSYNCTFELSETESMCEVGQL